MIKRPGTIFFLYVLILILINSSSYSNAAPNDENLQKYIEKGRLSQKEAHEIKENLKKELKNEVIREIKEELKKGETKERIAETAGTTIKTELAAEIKNRLEAEKKEADDQAKKDKSRKLTIFGYSQISYLDDNSPAAAAAGFNIARIRMLTYKKLDDNFDFYFHGNITGNNDNYSKMMLLESVVRYNGRPGFQAWLGQFVIPFGIEVPLGSSKPHMINFAQINNNLDHEQFNEDLLDVGVRLDFEKKNRPLNLTLAIINGEGINRKNDSDDRKTIVGRLTYKAAKDLVLGASVLDGRRYKNAAAASTSFGRYAAATPGSYFDRKRNAFDFRYTGPKWFWQGEYCFFETGMAGRSENLKGKGGYIETGYRIRPKFELTLKNEVFTPDTSDTSTKREIKACGFNWYFSKITKLQLVYENRIEQPGKTLNNDLFAAQYTLEY